MKEYFLQSDVTAISADGECVCIPNGGSVWSKPDKNIINDLLSIYSNLERISKNVYMDDSNFQLTIETIETLGDLISHIRERGE